MGKRRATTLTCSKGFICFAPSPPIQQTLANGSLNRPKRIGETAASCTRLLVLPTSNRSSATPSAAIHGRATASSKSSITYPLKQPILTIAPVQELNLTSFSSSQAVNSPRSRSNARCPRRSAVASPRVSTPSMPAKATSSFLRAKAFRSIHRSKRSVSPSI